MIKTQTSYLVFFDVVKDNKGVEPPFIAGTVDCVWVIAENSKDALTAAKNKIELCYGEGMAKNFRV